MTGLEQRRDVTQAQVRRPTALMRRDAVYDLRARVRHGRAGDDAVALLLDLYEAGDRPVSDVHYRRWLEGAGFSDDVPEVAP